MPVDPMLAYMLMNQQRPKSPLASLASGFQQGYGAPSANASSGMFDAGGSGIWADIGDFLTGNRRKRQSGKADDGELKSWANPNESSILSSSLGLGDGYP